MFLKTDIESCIILYLWIHHFSVIVYILWHLPISLKKTQSIKNSKISISEADMKKKHIAFRMVLFFMYHNIFSSVSGTFPHRRRSSLQVTDTAERVDF